MSLILHRREVKMLTDAGAGFGCAEGVVDIEVGAWDDEGGFGGRVIGGAVGIGSSTGISYKRLLR